MFKIGNNLYCIGVNFINRDLYQKKKQTFELKCLKKKDSRFLHSHNNNITIS